jgi:hypothetical protein
VNIPDGNQPKSPKDLPPEVLKKLTEALDAIGEIMEGEDEGQIIGSRNERRGFSYKLITQRRRKWQRPRQCVFPGCDKISVPASHTIQRGGPLSFIAEDRHVLTPGFSFATGEIVMEEAGIGEASTFPGFCAQHEQIFTSFETTGQLLRDRDAVLQAFRTICREVVVKRAEVIGLERILAAYNEVISPKRRDGNANGAWKANSDLNKELDNARNIGLRVIHRVSVPNFELARLPIEENEDGTIKASSKEDKPWRAYKIIQENPAVAETVKSLLKELLSGQSAEKPFVGAFDTDLKAATNAWAAQHAPNDKRFKFD